MPFLRLLLSRGTGAVMATVVLMSRWVRRRAWTPTLLLLPLALMLAWNPRLRLMTSAFNFPS